MKILDYAGLQRLTSNIKDYIASKLQPVDDRAPYKPESMLLVRGNAFFANSPYFTPVKLTLTASDTGDKKALYDRFLKGLPSALLFDTAYNPSTYNKPYTVTPFYLVEGYLASSYRTIAVYRSSLGITGTANSQVEISVDIYRPISGSTQPTVSLDYAVTNYPEDNTPLLPFHAKMFDVNASGIVAPSGAQSISASSSGDALALFNRLKLGFPPSIRVDITLSNGTDTIPVWLYLKSIVASGGATYESNSISNGSYSNQCLRFNCNPSGEGYRVALSRFSVSS